MSRIKVLLVDDHTVVRQGLRALLEIEPDMDIVGEAANGRDAVGLAKKLRPEVVIMDVAMPLLNGGEATRQILEHAPTTKVLVLTSYGDDDCVSMLLGAGAAGFLVKSTAANDLARAVREIYRGNGFFSPAVARRLRELNASAFNNGHPGRSPKSLTVRETEVLELIADGCSNKEAAVELGISVKTIEKHRQQLMNKLNIHEVAGLTRYAVSRGIVEGVPKELLTAV